MSLPSAVLASDRLVEWLPDRDRRLPFPVDDGDSALVVRYAEGLRSPDVSLKELFTKSQV
jgi:hypothetical protein